MPDGFSIARREPPGENHVIDSAQAFHGEISKAYFVTKYSGFLLGGNVVGGNVVGGNVGGGRGTLFTATQTRYSGSRSQHGHHGLLQVQCRQSVALRSFAFAVPSGMITVSPRSI